MVFPTILGWFKLVLLACILAEALARIGAGVLGFLAFGNCRPLEKFGLGYLLGLGVLGTFLLGLACASLYCPVIIWLSTLLLLYVSIRRDGWRPLTNEAIRSIGFLGPGLALLIIGAAASHYFLYAVLNHDSYVYHMSLPWQCLMVHKIPLTAIPFTMHYPLPADMPFVFGILAGDDRLVKFMVLFAFLSVCAVFADWCARRRIQYASWLGPLLVLSSGILLAIVVQAKNDVPAAAFFVAGAILWIRRKWGFGALMIGLSLAAKEIYLPLIGVYMAFHLHVILNRPWVLTLIILAIAPWLVKSYLATGAPFFPFLSGLLPAYDWSERNQLVLNSFLEGAGETRFDLVIGSAVRQIRRHLPLIVALLPAIYMLKDLRRLLAACLVGTLVTAVLVDIPRYWLPAIWLMSLISAIFVNEMAVRFRPWVAMVIALLSLGQSLYILRPYSQNWRELLLSRDDFLERRLTTFEEAVRKVGEIGPKRIIAVGERLIYRLPARVLYGGQLGETPLIWKLASESDNATRLAIKFRQLGASHLLYNYVSAEWLGMRYIVFPWSKRMLRMYVDYCKLHQDMIWRTHTNNYDEGGMVLYRLEDRAIFPKPKNIWFAPGMEQLYGLGPTLRAKREYSEFMKLAQANYGLIPDVGTAWNELGYAYLLMGDSEKAHFYLKEFADAGMMDGLNLVNYGIAARLSGRSDKGRRLLREAEVRCIGQREIIGRNLEELGKEHLNDGALNIQ